MLHVNSRLNPEIVLLRKEAIPGGNGSLALCQTKGFPIPSFLNFKFSYNYFLLSLFPLYNS